MFREVVRPVLVILFALACLFAALAYEARGADMPAADPAKPAITLDAPKSVPAGAGYLKVRATAAAPVAFDVEAQFDQEGLPFQFEQLDPFTLLVGIPAAVGVIRIEAAVAVDGKPPVFAKAFIEVVKKETPPDPAKPAGKPVGKLFAVFVEASAGPADSPTLAKAIADLGDEKSVLADASPAIASQGLTKFVADAGGAPCLILMDAAGDVHKAVKTPPDEAAIVALIKDVHAGK